MALNLWNIGGQQISFNPLPIGLTKFINIGIGNYIISFRAKSASGAIIKSKLNTQALFPFTQALTTNFVTYTFSINSGINQPFYLYDLNNIGDIIIDSVLLVQKPLPKLTINGIDGFLSGKWVLDSHVQIIDDQTLQLNATAGYQTSTLDVPVLPYTNYVLSGMVTGGITAWIDISWIDANNSIIGSIGVRVNSSIQNCTFTSPSNAAKARINLTSSTAGTFTFKQPMLMLGSIQLPFQAKVAIGAKMQMPTPRKNMLFVDNYSINGATNGESVNITNGLLQGAAYTLSGLFTMYADDNATNPRATIILNYSDGTTDYKDTSNFIGDGVERYLTVTVQANKLKYLISIKLYIFNYGSGTNMHRSARQLQFEQGAVATTYTPYAVQVNKKPQKYVPKKNLFDGNLTDGYWSNGIAYNTAGWVRTVGFIPVVPNLTYIWTLADGSSLGDSTLTWYDINKNQISNDYLSNHGTSVIRQMPSNAYYVTLHLRGTDKALKMQFELALILTPYEPYQLIVPRSKTGLSFNGISDYLQLPSLTIDSIELDCNIDSNQPNNNFNAYLFDARNGSSAYFSQQTASFINALYVNGVSQSIAYSSIPLGQRIKLKFNFNTINPSSIQIFNVYAPASYPNRNGKGILYKVTCYLAGNIVAQYDFENKNTVFGNTVLPNTPQKNLIPNFEDTGWTIHPNAKVQGKDVLHLDATAAYQGSFIDIEVISNVIYRLQGETDSIRFYSVDKYDNTGSKIGTVFLQIGNKSLDFTVESNVKKIRVTCTNKATGFFDFIKLQLYQLTGIEGTLYGAPKQLNKSAKRQLYAKR